MTDKRRIDHLEARIEAIEDLVVNIRKALDPNKRYKDYAQKKLNDIYESDNIIKSVLTPLEAWLNAPSKPLIVYGYSGVGKTGHDSWPLNTTVEVETTMNPIACINNARHPSFDGNYRLALIEGADYLTTSQYRAIYTTDNPPPYILECQFLESIPYKLRQKCMVVEIQNLPSDS